MSFQSNTWRGAIIQDVLALLTSSGKASRQSFTGAQDNVNTVFVLAVSPDPNVLQVFRNGMLQSPGVDYTLAGAVVTMTSFVPQPSDGLQFFA